jgi:hypothetical protein
VVWTGLIWLWIGTGGGFLWTRQWTFGFHKMLVNSWVPAQQAASQEGLSSMELVFSGVGWCAGEYWRSDFVVWWYTLLLLCFRGFRMMDLCVLLHKI